MERVTYSVELNSIAPIHAVGIKAYSHVPGNPRMGIGGGSSWNTCGHEHRTFEAAIACGRAINKKAGKPNECEFA